MLDSIKIKMLEIKHALKKKKNILVVGPNGMLGQEVYKMLSTLSEDRSSVVGNVWKISHSDVDFTYKFAVEKYFSESDRLLPDVVINCAGFTDTAAIQADNDTYDKAYRANVLLPKFLASACASRGIKFVHVSTDYVMSEYSSPCSSGDPVEFPVSVYGLQKLIAENFIKEEFSDKASSNYLIARTSWLYGKNNKSKTFPEKIAMLLVKKAIERIQTGKPQHLDVDVFTKGYPTSTVFLATFIANAIKLGLTGTVDAFQPDNAGNLSAAAMTRTDFAEKILQRLNQKIPNLGSYVSVKASAHSAVQGKFTMRHPETLPKMIATGHDRKKYVRCEAASIPVNDTLTDFIDHVWKNSLQQMLLDESHDVYTKLMEDC